MNELKHEYRLVTGNVDINTPFCKDLSEVQKILIEKTDRNIKAIHIYPKDFILYFDQTASSIIVRTNFPLEENEDGSFDVIFS
ncbi:hypothetical protein ABXS71_16790 [Bacillus infantis]|uniref:hypothetical protein n=1 Tax=Bacillus infantis TaxID=324767 RepID=UPI0034510F57